MNSVGIDVSKGKSMIAVMRPFGEVVVSPFEIHHTDSELCELTKLLSGLSGETRVVMESTGNYHLPVAWLLNDSGFYVSVVNAMLVHDYGNNSLRRAKTDKKDAIKLANYGLDHWLTLPRYVPEEDTRLMLKNCYRQYQQYSKVRTMLKNNLISLLDTAFPGANRLFSSPPRADGSEKCYAEDRYCETSSRASCLSTSGNLCSFGCLEAGNAIFGIFTPGISRGDEDVWRWPSARPTAHGRNRRCPALPFQESTGGFCGH